VIDVIHFGFLTTIT